MLGELVASPFFFRSRSSMVEHPTFNRKVEGSSPTGITILAGVAEAVDAQDLKSCCPLRQCEFKSHRPHQKIEKCDESTERCKTRNNCENLPKALLCELCNGYGQLSKPKEK